MSGFVVRRSALRGDSGIAIAHLPADALHWTDTTTEAGGRYWYALVADVSRGGARSNPASASTPTYQMNVERIAVSTTDQHLYAFGTLSNGLPRVVRISPNGDSVERSDGVLVDQGHAFDPYVSDAWLADLNGGGVLHFRMTNGELPTALLGAVRQRPAFLRAYVAAAQQGGAALRAFTIHQAGPPIASVDEAAGAIWFEPGGGGSAASMDCLGLAALCWLGFERRVELRTDAGATLVTVQLTDINHGCAEYCATAIFADPTDSSAWVMLGRSARVLHIDHTGAILRTITLGGTGPFSFGLGDIGSQTATIDRERRALWLTGQWNGRSLALLRIDLGALDAAPRIVATGVPSFVRLASDMRGGVWVVTQDTARHLDLGGHAVAAVAFNPK